jgi:hypothetical protein
MIAAWLRDLLDKARRKEPAQTPQRQELPLTVTERSNAATEERLKSGHAVGGESIV